MKRFLSLVLPAAGLLVLLLPVGAGAAGPPVLSFDPANWDYGTIAPGAKASQTFVLTNTGGSATAALTVRITGAAAFTKTADSCSATSLGKNKSCSITVEYSPSAAGAADAAILTAMSKKPNATANAGLTGQGTPANSAPFAFDDGPYSAAEDVTLVVGPVDGVLRNDIDPDGDQLTAELVSHPAGGISFNADGSFSYFPLPGFFGTDSFVYRASDGSLSSNFATVTIFVTPVNDAPIANNDSYTVNEGGTLNVAGPGVLGNDSDIDGPALTAVLVSGPAHASSFALNPDGSFVYVHNGSETSTDSFTYKANDGSLDSNIATVTITVVPVNEAPIANPDVVLMLDVGSGFGLLLDNDFDPDGDPLQVVAPCQELVINTDGVVDAASKLPGLTATITDADPSDGTPCNWQIETTDGRSSSWVLDSLGRLFTGIGPADSPLSGLELGDTLLLTSTYTVSDNAGGTATSVFQVEVFSE